MDAVTEGHYYRKQLGCKSGIIAWSHSSRFRIGLKLIGKAPRNLLDYGSGDGTFLVMASDRIGEGWGADISPVQVEDCQKRLVSIPNLHFSTIDVLRDGTHDGKYDIVTCMETLEHCTAASVEIVLRDLARFVSPGGRVIISVPIEIGPTFLLKAVVRKAAARRGLSDYSHYEHYKFRDALRMMTAGRAEVLERPVYGKPEMNFHSHYGFNWKALRERVKQSFAIERVHFSPLGFLGGWVSSQVWFVCKPRVESGAPALQESSSVKTE